MSFQIIRALIQKDATLMLRNRFFAVVLVLGLVVYVGIYLAMPSEVDEQLKLGIVSELPPGVIEQLEDAGGLAFQPFSSVQEMEDAITQNSLTGGIVLPDDFFINLQSGQAASAQIYISSTTPDEFLSALTVLLQEIAYRVAGHSPDILIDATVLGKDTTGAPVAPRDSLLPLFAVFILLTEMMSLASLMSEEIETHTIRALMVTPVNIKGLFLAKGITGTGMAFIQAGIFLAIVGGFSSQPLLVLVILLLGAVMATAVGFLVASGSKDLLSVMAWGVLLMLVFSTPAFTVIFPGSGGGWVEVIPSFYLVEALNQVVNYSAGWQEVWPSLVRLAGFNAAIFAIGMWALRRKLG